MYEQEEPVLRRVLLIALWFIIIVTVAWAIVWLVFFRHSNPAPQTHTTHPSGSSAGQSSNGTGSRSTTSPSTNSSPNTSPSVHLSAPLVPGSGSAAQSPNGLANAGAGNIFVPFTVASVTGAALYYIRLRKRLLR